MVKICLHCVHYRYSTKACYCHDNEIEYNETCKHWQINSEYELEVLREENINLKIRLMELEWVPMNKRLPNHDEEVIVFGVDNKGTEYMAFLTYDKDNHDECYGEITHWMLIPKSPSKPDIFSMTYEAVDDGDPKKQVIASCVECSSYVESLLSWCRLTDRFIRFSSRIPEWCPLQHKDGDNNKVL